MKYFMHVDKTVGKKNGGGRNENCVRVVYIWLFPDISIITSGNTF